MRGQNLSYLPFEWEDWVFASAWVFQKASPGVLGLAWKKKKEWEEQLPPVLYLASIDCDTGVLNHREAYQWHGIDMEELQLWSGNTLGEWIVTWQASQPANILLYRVRWDMQLASTAPVVIDEMTEDMTRMGPVVFVAATEPDITAILLQPAFDDTGPTLVRVSHIARKNMGQPKHVGFAKPIFDVVKQRGQEKSVKTQIIETALKAGVHVHVRSWYLLMFDVENDMSEDFVVEFPNFTSTVKGRPYWCFWVTGGSLPVSKPTWKYQFHIKIPADSAPYGSFRDDVMVGAFIINGPIWVQSLQVIQQTVIVAIGLIKKEAIGLPDEQARPLRGGELVCLSEHEQVVQECKEEIVEQVELCLVGDTVIGIDRIQRRWRLWRWEPLAGKEQFTMVRLLDESVVHAHVVTNHENSDPQGTQFWLIEERPEGLRVSRRDGQTLEETEEPLVLQHYSLPYSLERSIGHWDWPVKKGIIGHNDALLLIAADEQNRMVLYRVEAEKQ